MEAALRDADFGCGPHTACYDPAIPDGASWWPDWFLVIIIVALVLILLWALLKSESKPKDELGREIDKIIDKAKREAVNWDDTKAERAIDRVGREIRDELAKRGLLTTT
jgi:hypothetical protein